MKNWIQPGKVITLTAPSGGVTAGQMYKIGSAICVASSTVAQGLPFEAAVEEVFDVTSDTGTAYAEGDLLYWDNTGRTVTKTATSNTKCGYAIAAKASADVVARVKLVPSI